MNQDYIFLLRLLYVKKNILSALISFVFLTGCLVSEENSNILSKIENSTCLSATAIAFDGALIRFAIPEQALSFRVSRNGNPIVQTNDKNLTEQIDKDLLPGQTYRYKCQVLVDQDRGYEDVGPELELTLEANDAPDFEGIKSVNITGPSSVNVTWNLTMGAIISHFKIFKYIGVAASKADFPSTPALEVNSLFSISQAMTNLGDEITYSFRVVACNSSDVCDDNDAIATVTMPDAGAAQTVGATLIAQENGNVVLTAPWADRNGFVAKRTVFRAATALGANCPGFNSYTELNSVLIADPKNTPQTIQASGVLNEGSRYCFIVRDTDPTGNITASTTSQFVDIFDITPPDFISAITLENDIANPETTLKASWTAMARQIDEPLTGASHYDVYVSSTDANGTPDADPCSTGTLFTSLQTNAHPQGSTVEVLVNGLQPRDKHRVCVRARDTFNNLSAQRPNALLSTQDVTPPNFVGIQSAAVNTGLNRVDISFVVPPDSDVRNYKITTIRTRNSVVNTPIEIIKTFGALTPGATQFTSFTFNEASLIDDDSVAIRIDACDDASPTFNIADNCTTTPAEESVVLPDVTSPPNFAGVSSATAGAAHRSLLVSWSLPVDRSDYAGIKVFFVNDLGNLVGVNSIDCICQGNDCETNPKTSCTVDRRDDGQFLLPSKSYEVYIRAFDAAGNVTDYLEHTGINKVTAFGTTSDIIAPSFNASMDPSLDAGEAKILFSEATDDQDPSLEIEYELYKKTGTTFTCPLTPFESAGGCDNLTPTTVVLQSALDTEGGRLKIVDAAVVDGETYFYQLCALDVADNRTCQVGAVGELIIEDTTPPVVTNADTNKMFGGGGSWTVSFDVSDNIVDPDNLIIRAYKSLVDFPDQNNLGVPDFEKAGGSIVVAGSTASFVDSGTPDVQSAYYLIQVQDLKGNRTFVELRDMPPAPIITSITWPDPLTPAGHPVMTDVVNDSANPGLTITGQNLTHIAEINRAGSGAQTHDIRSCVTATIATQTDSQIFCNFNSTGVYYTTARKMYIEDDRNRPIQIIDLDLPTTYCAYAAANGITALNGLGTVAEPYAICSPDHIKLIGRNADNPNNSEDIVGHFVVGQDLDFTGITDFKGIPVMDVNDFSMSGHLQQRNILNLTIDTSATNEDAAFLLGCTGSQSVSARLMSNIGFDNATIKTGNGRAAVAILDKTCDIPNGQFIFNVLRVENSLIESNNTAGFVAAEFTGNGERYDKVTVTNSTLKSTRPDATTAVGGVFGKYTATTSNAFNRVVATNINFLPADGQSNSGYNIGGVIGEVTGNGLSTGRSTTSGVQIYGGVEHIGGFIGQMKGPVSNFSFNRPTVASLDIFNSGVVETQKAGVFAGSLTYDAVTPSSDITLLTSGGQVNLIHGASHLGGLFGFVESVDNLEIRNIYVRFSDFISTSDFVGGVIGELKNATNFQLSAVTILTGATAVGVNKVGGLIGQITGGSNLDLFDNRIHNDSDVTGSGSDTGGLVGRIDNADSVTIEESAIGLMQVSGVTRVGGFVGSVDLSPNFTLANNYINPDTNAAINGDSSVGGFIGELNYGGAPTSVALIQNNGNFGLVTSAVATNVGAAIGLYNPAVDPSGMSYQNNYFRNDFADVNAVTTNPTYSGLNEIEGKTLVELQDMNTYVNWDVDGGSSLWETSTVGNNTAALKAHDGAGVGL